MLPLASGASLHITSEFGRPVPYPEESISGLQLMCLMFVGFKCIAPDQDVGMDLNEPWVAALELFNTGR